MSAYKIIFTGPVGAGKTTSIAAISDIEPFVTERIATDETSERKEHTTVAMDYGMIKLGNGDHIHLYGTPGQDRFDFMWDILAKNGLGLVVMIDNKRPDPLDDLKFFLTTFAKFIKETSVVIGVTRMDLCDKPCIRDYHNMLNKMELRVPVYEVDGRVPSDVVTLIQTLLYCLDPNVAVTEKAS